MTVCSDHMLERLVSELRACDAAPDGLARPAAILWLDPERQWLPLKPLLLGPLPELLVLGDYEPSTRTGPAIWLRCMIGRTLDEPAIPEDRVPILYLPGVGRQDLRAGDDCRDELKPLVELMYRGALWLQRGNHEWTVSAFLTSADGLGLRMARDQATREALARALPEVATTPVAQFQGRHLEAEDFDRLLSSDVVRDLLRWMGEPEATRQRMGPERWAAFCSQCRDRFGFDPARDGELTAGERLGLGEGAWAELWQRFAEAPQAYPGIPALLRRARPAELAFDRSRWPDLNDEAEQAVRAELGGLASVPHHEACERVVALDQEHAERRGWLWASIGLSPMALVLEPLARLAKVARGALGGSTPDQIAEAYVDQAWQADAASWEAVAQAPTADERLIKEAVRALLGPWLDQSARAFQQAAETYPLPAREAPAVSAEAGMCLLFVDGLRYDVGRRLAERLEGRGYGVRVGHRWAALPTVTATAKPAVTPVAGRITGGELPEDFAPHVTETGRKADAETLRETMRAAGYQVLGGELGDWPHADDARGWAEAGVLDRRGHELQDELPGHIVSELDRLVERVGSLLEAGWGAVRIVTDHGWLLLPLGLSKVDLPRHLTASRWARCAVVAGQSQVDAPVFPWHWNSAQRFATAPGAAAFNAGASYAHGGLSVQECLVPELTVEASGQRNVWATIRSVTWRGMRCVVEAEAGGAAVMADLRLERPNGPTVTAAPKQLDEGGTARLLVADDAYEDAALVLVLTDQAGTVLAQRKTKVGAST